MPASLTLRYCLLCDDVRIERSHKDIIVGVYGSGMVLKNLPGSAAVRIWAHVIWHGEGHLGIEIRVLDPIGKEAGSLVSGGISMLQDQPSSMTFPPITFSVPLEGEYIFQWRPKGTGTWQLMTTTVIRKAAG